MANSKQAAKRAKQAEKARKLNMAQRSQMRTMIKKVRAAIEAKAVEEARSAFLSAQSTIDKYAGKGLIHKNTAARYKSRLTKQIKGLEAA